MSRLGFKREVLELLVENTQDTVTQENFDRIRQVLEKSLFLRFDGDAYELTFTGAVTNFKFAHNLGFIPKDAWITSEIGAGSTTFNYDKFTSQEMDITTTGAVTVRFVAGVFV